LGGGSRGGYTSWSDIGELRVEDHQIEEPVARERAEKRAEARRSSRIADDSRKTKRCLVM
jgi:hypothetical protein